MNDRTQYGPQTPWNATDSGAQRTSASSSGAVPAGVPRDGLLPKGYTHHPDAPGWMWNPSTDDVQPIPVSPSYPAQPANTGYEAHGGAGAAPNGYPGAHSPVAPSGPGFVGVPPGVAHSYPPPQHGAAGPSFYAPPGVHPPVSAPQQTALQRSSSTSASPALAGVLSFGLVGAGQLYNGEIGKGIGMFFGCIFLWIFYLGWIVNIWSIVDAVQAAKKRQETAERSLPAPAFPSAGAPHGAPHAPGPYGPPQ